MSPVETDANDASVQRIVPPAEWTVSHEGSPAGRGHADRHRSRMRRLAFVLCAGVGVLIATAAALRAIGRRRRYPSTPSRLVRVVMTAIDLRRRPSHAITGSLADALRSLRRPPVPRPVSFLVIKRTNPRAGSLGHWWIEIDGAESYGWWPSRRVLGWLAFIVGTRGALNGTRRRPVRRLVDPHHLDEADHAFHPTLVVRKRDLRVRADVRRFAHRYRGDWRWRAAPSTADCRTFQLRLLDAVGLVEGHANLHTRGGGCPFMQRLPGRARRERRFAAGSLGQRTQSVP